MYEARIWYVYNFVFQFFRDHPFQVHLDKFQDSSLSYHGKYNDVARHQLLGLIMLLPQATTMECAGKPQKKHNRNLEPHNAWESRLSKLAKKKENRYYYKYILDAPLIERHNSLTLRGLLRINWRT